MLFLIVTIITLSMSVGLALLGSQGDILSDLSARPFNYIFIVILCALAGLLSKVSITDKNLRERGSYVLLSAWYFYAVFICFMEGHAGGWAPSKTFFDKLVLMVVISFVLGVTLIFPALALLLGALYQLTIYFLKKHIS